MQFSDNPNIDGGASAGANNKQIARAINEHTVPVEGVAASCKYVTCEVSRCNCDQILQYYLQPLAGCCHKKSKVHNACPPAK